MDTSVWRSYFRGASNVRRLGDLLDEDDSVLVHPFIIGELVLGGLSTSEEELLARLPTADLVPHEEVLDFVRRRRLMRRGIGWVDAHLLASALTASAVLWSLDADLAAAAAGLKVNLRAAIP
ncbi:MAG TPA: PIN domain-containing protein [Acidobacteriota bacterium]